MLGIANVYQGTKETNDEALKRFNLAIERDPEFSAAYRWGAYAMSFARLTVGAFRTRRRSPTPSDWLEAPQLWAGTMPSRFVSPGMRLSMLAGGNQIGPIGCQEFRELTVSRC